MKTGFFSILLCYFNIYVHAAQEPRCSKSSYEEELLERLVRIEFVAKRRLEGVRDVENRVKEEIKKLQLERETFERERNEFGKRTKEEVERSITNKLNELSNDVDEKIKEMENGAIDKISNFTSETMANLRLLKNDVEKNTENLMQSEDSLANKLNELSIDVRNHVMQEMQTFTSETTSALVSLKNDIAKNLKHSVDVFTRLSSDLSDLKNETAKEIIELAKRPTILFRARNLTDWNPRKGQKLVFGTILENQGSGYVNDTGIFTAPMDGVYIFSLQLCSHSTRDFNFSFMQDGIEKQHLEFQQGSYGCGTAVYVTQIKTGTEIYIESKYSHLNDRLFSDSNRWNVFSGILIK